MPLAGRRGGLTRDGAVARVLPAGRRLLAAGRRLLPALGVTAALAGCGTSGTTPTEKAESTVATLIETCARADGEAVLGLLTPPTRSSVIEAESVTAGCERVLDLGVESAVEGQTVFGEAVVLDVAIQDDVGTATIGVPEGRTSELELENTGGRWLVSNPPL